MIELVSAGRCIACDKCIKVCPTDVFDRGEDGIPVLARRDDCQTCFQCEANCPADALFVAPLTHPLPDDSTARDEGHLDRTGLLGSYRRHIGWDEAAPPARYGPSALPSARQGPREPPCPSPPDDLKTDRPSKGHPRMTTSTAFGIRRIGGRIGAEILGVDLSTDLAPAVVTEINSALLEHKALVFRNQDLDDAGQLRFASLFGELTTAHPTVPSVDGQPNILPVDGDEGIRANQWHTDVTFVRTPPKASTLRSIVVPPYGGHTLVANSAAAYRDLPEPLRELADKLWAVHTNDYDYAAPKSEKAAEHRRRFVSRKYRTAHPVVRVHPETGERGLFIGGFAQSIVGLGPSDSRDLLRIFQSYVTRPENIVRVAWTPGDLVLFDNRITQHYAPDDYGDLPRLLHRVTVAGDVPAGVDGTLSHVIEGDDAAHYTPAAA